MHHSRLEEGSEDRPEDNDDDENVFLECASAISDGGVADEDENDDDDDGDEAKKARKITTGRREQT